MKIGLKNIFLIFAIALILGSAFGQNPISFHTNVDSTLTGIDIPVQISIPNTSNRKEFYVEVLDNVGFAKIYVDRYDLGVSKERLDSLESVKVDYEITDFGHWQGSDNKLTAKGNSLQNTIKLKIWDVGNFTILPKFKGDSSDNSEFVYPDLKNNYINLTVLSSTMPNDSIAAELAEIKDIIREEKNWQDYMIWIILALGLVVISLAVWLIPKFLKKKKTELVEKEEEKPIIPAHIIALQKLNTLKSEKIWLKGNYKQFQSDLTYTLREYLENRYEIKALEMTTSDISRQLTDFGLSVDDNKSLVNILQIADLVKFAKVKPDEDIHEEFLNDTIDFVKRTKEEKEQSDVE